jgi:long-subunit fatty acid transport protein
MKKNTIIFISILLTLFIITKVESGDTNFTPIIGARTFALNGLYLAGSDGIATIVSNPASLLYLHGRGLETSIIERYGQQQLSRDGTDWFRSFRDSDFAFSGGFYWVVSSRLAIALSAHRDIDYQVEWPYAVLRRKGTTAGIAGYDIYNRIMIDAISPSFAFQIDRFKIGLTVLANRIQNYIAFPIGNTLWYADQGKVGYQFKYQMDGMAFRFNLGTMVPLNDKLRLGVSLQSGLKTTLEGNATSELFWEVDSINVTKVDLSANFELPWTFGAGIVYQLADQIDLNWDIAYHLWSGIQQTYDFEFSDNRWFKRLAAPDSFAGVQGNQLNHYFHNSIDIGIGAEYKYSEQLVFRSGYRFSQSPNESKTFHLLYPGVHQHWLSIGIGYYSGNYNLDACLAYAFGMSQETRSSDNFVFYGKFDSDTVLPAVSLKYHF